MSLTTVSKHGIPSAFLPPELFSSPKLRHSPSIGGSFISKGISSEAGRDTRSSSLPTSLDSSSEDILLVYHKPIKQRLLFETVTERANRFLKLPEEMHLVDNFSCADADAAVLNFLRQFLQMLSVSRPGG